MSTNVSGNIATPGIPLFRVSKDEYEKITTGKGVMYEEPDYLAGRKKFYLVCSATGRMKKCKRAL